MSKILQHYLLSSWEIFVIRYVQICFQRQLQKHCNSLQVGRTNDEVIIVLVLSIC